MVLAPTPSRALARVERRMALCLLGAAGGVRSRAHRPLQRLRTRSF